MKPVLFAGTKPLERAENLKAAFDAYEGEKAYVQVDPWRRHPAITSGEYDVMVIDEYPTVSPGQTVCIGHGIAGGKTGGLLQPHPYFHASQSALITYTITSGTAAVDLVARSDGIPRERVLPLGMPRTDQYVGKKKGDGGTALSAKRAYLYVPTYRSREEGPMPEIDWDWLDRELTDDEVLAVKAHTMTGCILKRKYRRIIEISPNEPSTPYLYDCDAVITDYSSIMFDGYLLGKPAVLLEKQEGYTSTRGMNMRYPQEYSSRYCRNEKDLLGTLRAVHGLGELEREVIHRVADACDGHACERLGRLLTEMAESA